MEERSSPAYISGRRRQVRRMLCFLRQRATLTWWPERRMGDALVHQLEGDVAAMGAAVKFQFHEIYLLVF